LKAWAMELFVVPKSIPIAPVAIFFSLVEAML
jgi:hypothetical protein